MQIFFLQKPHIILINGTSSAGKSTLLNEFKNLCPHYITFQADQWFAQKLNEKARSCGWCEDSSIDPWLYLYNYTQTANQYVFAHALRQEIQNDLLNFYAQALQELEKGKSVIIDIVFDYEAMHQEFYAYFQGITIIKILVYCPAKILLQRVALRNSLGIPEQKRTAFQTFEQFPAFFILEKDSMQQQIVDRVNVHLLQKTLDLAIQDLIHQNVPSVYILKLNQFKDYFMHYYSLDDDMLSKNLVSKYYYDIILPSGNSSAYALAHQLVDFLNYKQCF